MSKTFVFALTPPEKAFDDAYELGIKGACHDVDAYCERVEPSTFDGTIGDRIHILISKADIVVAEMSTQNPEVFYQAGYAHALGKPVILVTQDGGDIPFNLNQYSHIVYGDSISDLKTELTKRLRWVIDNPDRTSAQAEFPLRFYFDGEPLDSLKKAQAPMKGMTTPNGDGLKIKLGFHNPTARPFNSPFSIAIITEHFDHNDSEAKVVAHPDGNFMHLFSWDATLLPDLWDTFGWVLRAPPGIAYRWGSEFEIEVIVFTEMGRLEYPLVVEGLRG